MTYAVLGYMDEGALDEPTAATKKSLHAAHRALHSDARTSAISSVRVIAHYRFRPPQHTTTLRLADDELVTTEGPSTETGRRLRALYLVESDDREAVVEFASQLPATRMGATVELWPLTGPHE